MYKTVISFNESEILKMSKSISNRYKPDVYTFHKFVYSLFPIEQNAKFSFNNHLIKSGKLFLIIQSNIEPIIPDFISKSQIKIMNISNDLIKSRKKYKFVIDINSSKRKYKNNGKEYYCPVKIEEINSWLSKRFENNGIKLKIINSISQSQDIFYGKKINEKTNKIVVNVSKISGEIEIEDYNKFIESLYSGIGREKSFGYGMLIIK